MSIATGQITIVDYNDALTLTGFIGSNHPKTQMFNPDNATFAPNWAVSNLVLTPSLYKLGTTADVITSNAVVSVKWYEGTSTTPITSAGNYALSGVKSHILTVKKNLLLDLPGLDFICEVTYLDPITTLQLKHKMSITFSKTINGGGIATALAYAPQGNVFKNEEITWLTAYCTLWRGSVEDTDKVTYTWFVQDPNATSDTGGGVGWRKLTSDTPNQFTGVTTATISVHADAVPSYLVLKCIILDTDTASGTYNQKFSDTISFIDNSDPIQIIVHSTGGTAFKNGEGSSTLTAQVYQAGQEVDSTGTKYTYTWSKYTQAGLLDQNFSKTGKSIQVTGDDVDVKAVFNISLTNK